MPQLPDPFLPDWQLDPTHYPTVFVVDERWSATPTFEHATRSLITKPLTGNTPLDTPKPTDNHGEKTLQVIRSLAKGLPPEKVILVSMDRANEFDNSIQHRSNLLEALISVQVLLETGDLVVINLGSDQGLDSFSRDPLIATLLEDSINLLGGIVIVASGNAVQPLLPTLTPDVVVVGGISADGIPASRFGSAVTCYGVVPYNLPDLPPAYTRPVLFGHSSAATAYTAGMVLMMLNYSQSQGLTLTSKQVVGLLKANQIAFQVLSGTGTALASGNIPDWNKLRPAIDVLANPAI